jgi:hypothetical protein
VEEVSLAGISDDFSNTKKEAIFASKMNDNGGGDFPDFSNSGFGFSGDNLGEGNVF